jgi:hypothetical protein
VIRNSVQNIVEAWLHIHFASADGSEMDDTRTASLDILKDGVQKAVESIRAWHGVATVDAIAEELETADTSRVMAVLALLVDEHRLWQCELRPACESASQSPGDPDTAFYLLRETQQG